MKILMAALFFFFSENFFFFLKKNLPPLDMPFSLVPSPSFFARREARFARGRKKKGLVSSDRACVSFSSFSRNLDTSQYIYEKTSS